MKAIFTFLAIVLISNAIAQNIQLYEIPEFQKAIKNKTRTDNGEPGDKYWQNSSDYTLEVFIDTSANILKGHGTIVYHNNSPNVLKELHIRLYQDIYKAGSARNHPLLAEDIHSGTYIDSLKINDKPYIHLNKPVTQIKINRLNSNLYIQLSDSIVPGTTCVIKITWSFPISSSAWPRRMGRYSDDFFIAQWYPQVAVYDDILGWDNMPHYGLQEFYNDFNNYYVTITVPEGYMVWATGECDNIQDVLDQSVINNLNMARKSDSHVAIINSESYSNNFFKGNTWHFMAEHVPDFAFAAATNYIWYGTSAIVDQMTGRRVLIDVAYPEESSFPPISLQVAKDAILWASQSFPGIPYPFSHATSFFNDLGNNVSMEFPMIANDMIYPDVGSHKATLAHELFHNYFPFYVGLNETIYGWMDEGWVNFLEHKFTGDGGSLLEKSLTDYPGIAGTIYDHPLFSSTMDQSTFNRQILSYIKPAVNLILLEELMGKEAFLKATKDFINTWHGKHPTPYDFFYIFMKHAEDDISWFLKACYFEYGYADLGIESVNGNKITIAKKGNIPVSVKLEITFDDNTTERIYKNPGIWETGSTQFIVNLESNKIIKKIILGDSITPDIDMSDNIYDDLWKTALRICENNIILDSHIDWPVRILEFPEDISGKTLKGDFDLVRAKEGKLNAAFSVVYLNSNYGIHESRNMVDSLLKLITDYTQVYPEKFALANNPNDIKQNFKQNLFSLPLCLENGIPIGNDLEYLKYLKEQGIVYITLNHNKANQISDSNFDENRKWNGLSPFGLEVIKEMNRLGIMIDISHSTDSTVFQSLRYSEAPIIASHSSCRHFTPGLERNLSDTLIKAIANKNGVIMVNLCSMFLDSTCMENCNYLLSWYESNGVGMDSEEGIEFALKYGETHPIKSNSAQVVDHIDHIVKIAGIDHAGIGSDYDGMGPSQPIDLPDVSSYPTIVFELLTRGYKENDIKKILSGNFLRVWDEVLEIAAVLNQKMN